MKMFNKFLLIALVLGLGLTSCKDYVEGINEDPNNASDAPIDAIVNAAFTGMITAHEGEDARLGALWCQQFTGSDRQYSAFDNYIVNSENFEWDKFYLVRQNALAAIAKAEETDNQLVLGIAKVLQGHSMHAVSSLWGDIPFRTANKFPEVTDPEFDGMNQVYGDILSLCDEAIAHFGAGTGTLGSDFYFGASQDAWTKVANTLKARVHLHMGDYASAISAAGNGIVANADNWMIPHVGGQYNQDKNIYNSFGVDDREGYMTANGAYLPSIMDPASATYRGNDKTDETARFGHVFVGSEPAWDLNYADGAMWGATSPYPLITAVENHLIIAECHSRQSNDMEALNFLNSARALLAEQFPDGKYDAYEMADFESGGIANVPGKSGSESLMYEILEEKYCSLVGQIEAFADFRRTGNPFALTPKTGSQFPQRYLIPQVELDANANAPESNAQDLYEVLPLFQ